MSILCFEFVSLKRFIGTRYKDMQQWLPVISEIYHDLHTTIYEICLR